MGTARGSQGPTVGEVAVEWRRRQMHRPWSTATSMRARAPASSCPAWNAHRSFPPRPTTCAPRFGPPKTRASYRTVPLPSVVADALRAHEERFGHGPENLIFSDPKGTSVRRYRFNESWRKAVAASGVGRPVRFHDLRHFYASLLIAHGESVKVVQARLGHASAMETLDTYAHLWPDDGDQTRRAVDAVLGFGCS